MGGVGGSKCPTTYDDTSLCAHSCICIAAVASNVSDAAAVVIVGDTHCLGLAHLTVARLYPRCVRTKLEMFTEIYLARMLCETSVASGTHSRTHLKNI